MFDVVGRVNYKYPTDSTINGSDRSRTYFKEAQCELDYAIKLDGTKGIFFHEDATSTKILKTKDGKEHEVREKDLSAFGKGDYKMGSHGCLNLKEGDAKEVYDYVDGRTRVTISYNW